MIKPSNEQMEDLQNCMAALKEGILELKEAVEEANFKIEDIENDLQNAEDDYNIYINDLSEVINNIIESNVNGGIKGKMEELFDDLVHVNPSDQVTYIEMPDLLSVDHFITELSKYIENADDLDF